MRALGAAALLVLVAGASWSQWFYGGGTFAEEVVAAARSSLSDPRCTASDASGATVITCEAAP